MRLAWPFALPLLISSSFAVAAPPGLTLPPGARLIDLTHTFDDKTPYWPGSPPEHFSLQREFCGDTPQGFFICMSKLAAPEHGGTHVDAPLHFAKGHMGVDAIPLARLMAPAVVIDMRAQASADRDARLSAADVNAFEKREGPIAAGTIVLVRTGWAERAHDRARYFGTDQPDDEKHLHFPGVGEDAARLLVARKVAAVGIDTASIDHGPSQDFRAHQILLGADVPQLENLASLAELPARGAFVIALPMKIGGGTGAPVRVVAIVAGR